jgi:hypothetical protein
MGVGAPAIEKARAAQVAAMMVRIFMGLLDLPIGWCSLFVFDDYLRRATSACARSLSI